MEITIKKEATTLYITLDGDIISMKDGDKLSTTFHEITLMDDVEHVVFNMETVNSITSSGIGKFLNFFKHINSKHGSMEIKGISDNLYDQLLDIHLDRIFPVSR